MNINDYVYQDLMEELQERRTEAIEKNDRIWQLLGEIEQLRKERDDAREQTRRILNEIDCRIEHGAESNGHLEAIRNLFKEATDGK